MRFLILGLLIMSSFASGTEDNIADIHAAQLQEYKENKFIEYKRPISFWEKVLPKDKFHVMWEAGTERAFSGQFDKFYEPGIYRCGSCGNFLFSSKAKYDSKSGWPSFYDVFNENSITTKEDRSLFWSVRTEVLCKRCGAHLGHVFNDGPKDKTGLRYCMNSLALEFLPK